MILSNYNREMDENLSTIWCSLFNGLDVNIFSQALKHIIRTKRFMPNASEIHEAYENIMESAKQQADDAEKAESSIKIANQSDCYLCNNTSWAYYTENGNTIGARCICPRGVDRNVFSEPQIKQSYRFELPVKGTCFSAKEEIEIKRGNNPLYIKTIVECLHDNFAFYDSKKTAEYLERKSKDSKSQVHLLQQIYKNFM